MKAVKRIGFKLRLQPSTLKRIAAEAAKNNRSINGEMVWRLEHGLDFDGVITATVLKTLLAQSQLRKVVE